MLRRVALVRTDVLEELLRTLRSVPRLLVTVNVPSSPILVTLMMKALSSSVTSVLTRATRRNIQKDDIIHSLLRENLKSYIVKYYLRGNSTCRIFHTHLQLRGVGTDFRQTFHKNSDTSQRSKC
jgi:ABC-type antimicrobial peptide transport system permease subunit